MTDDLVKLEWRINSDTYAEAHPPFVIYIVQKVPSRGWQWTLFDGYYDEGSHSCEDMADGMSLAEKHWRDSVQPITKPLTDRIEELEAKLAKAVEALRWQADIINDSLTGNEVGKHRILLDGEYHEGPVVNWVHKILTGFEHINRATIAKLTGGKDE